ncbi:VCBS repeat-containing protein, partial [bacterium]|nr:VCBS repeat-containing protein [bacterium]
MNKPIKTLILFFLIVIVGCQNNKIYNYHWSYETGPTNAGNFHSVGTGDFNGDGNLDIVGGNFDPGGLYVWFGNGNGNWKSVFSPTNLGDIRDIACGDINNDGFDDVICTSFGDAKGVRVFLSNGDGTWSLASFPEEKGTYEGVEVADLNYDGNLDVAAANSSSASQSDGGVDIWFGNGKGQFSKNYGTQSTYEYRDVAIADLNNDGKLDIIATQWGVDGGIRVWYGTNRAEWYSGHSPKSVGSFMGLTTADFDRDGRIDICATAYNQGIFIWYQTEDGKFTEPCRIRDSGNFWEVQAKDLDFDGDFDIVATSFGSDGVRIFRNDWKCDWHDWKNLIHSDKTYYGLILGDFNNDSRSDIAAANYSQGIHIWLQVNDESIYRAEIPRPVENDTLDIWSLQKGTVSYGEAIYSIFFDTGIAEVREDQKSTINEIAELIKKYPQSKIRIEGNADIRAIATKEFPSNLELSQSRANSVKNALSQKITEVAGINFEGVVGFSDVRPKIYDAKTPEELQLNRRADVIIEKMKVETDKEVLNKINKFVYADSVDIYFDHY